MLKSALLNSASVGAIVIGRRYYRGLFYDFIQSFAEFARSFA